MDPMVPAHNSPAQMKQLWFHYSLPQQMYFDGLLHSGLGWAVQ